MATELGSGYISLVPSAKGFGPAVAAAITGPMEAAAATAGSGAGSSLEGGLLGALKGTSGKLLATLGFASIGVAFLKSAESVENANNIILRATGATGEKAEQLESTFKRIASSSPASFSTIATTLSEVAQRTDLTGTALEGLTRQIVTFNRISKDAPLNVQTLTQALAGFNVPAKDMGAELDRLFNISQKTGVPLASLVDTLTSAGPIARQFGFSLDFTAGFLAQLNKAGVDATSIMPGLRRAFIQFAKDGREPAAALRETIESIQNYIAVGDLAGARQIAVQLFGARGVGLVDAAIQGKISLQSLSEQIDTTGKGIQGTAASTTTLSAKLGILKNQATLALGELGTPALSTATSVFGSLTPVVGALGGGLAKLAPIMVPTLEVLLAMKVASLALAGAEALLGAVTNAVTINMAGFGATAEVAAVNVETAAVGIEAAVPAVGVFTATFILATAALNKWGNSLPIIGHGADELTPRVALMGAALKSVASAADAQLVPAFNKLVAAEQSVLRAQGNTAASTIQAGAVFSSFRKVAEENLGTAERLAQKYQQFPGTYQQLMSILGQVAGARKQEQSDLERSTVLTQDLDKAVQDLNSTLLGQADGALALEHANDAVTKAQDDLNAAVRDYGPFSKEAHDADLALRDAKLRQAEAAVQLQNEVDKLTKDYAGNNDAIDAEIAKLQEAENKYGANREAIDPLIAQLESLKTKVDLVPSGHSINFTIDAHLTPDAQAAVDMFDALAHAGIVLPGGAASGGDLAPGWFGWVGEQGPELMMVGPSGGATVFDAGTSRQMTAAAPASGGAGVAFHQSFVVRDVNAAAREAIRAASSELFLAGLDSGR